MNVFALWHFKINADENWSEIDRVMDFKAIGIYSSESKVKAAIARKRQELGFRDWPDGFRIITHVLDSED